MLNSFWTCFLAFFTLLYSVEVQKSDCMWHLCLSMWLKWPTWCFFLYAIRWYATVFLQWAAETSSCQKMWTLCEDLLQPEGSVQFMSTASWSKIYCFSWSDFPNSHLAVARMSQGGTTWRGWHICSPPGCRNIHPISQQVGPSLLVFRKHLWNVIGVNKY